MGEKYDWLMRLHQQEKQEGEVKVGEKYELDLGGEEFCYATEKVDIDGEELLGYIRDTYETPEVDLSEQEKKDIVVSLAVLGVPIEETADALRISEYSVEKYAKREKERIDKMIDETVNNIRMSN